MCQDRGKWDGSGYVRTRMTCERVMTGKSGMTCGRVMAGSQGVSCMTGNSGVIWDVSASLTGRYCCFKYYAL